MHPDLAHCRRLLEQATAGLDDAAGARRSDGRWSIAEIVEHLDRTYTGTVKGFERTLAAGLPRASPATVRGRLRKFVVVSLGYFPSGIPAPRHVVPSGDVTLSEVMARSLRDLAEMDVVLRRALERFGSRPMLDHPVLGPFTPRDWARFHRVHTRHHCRQIVERRRIARG